MAETRPWFALIDVTCALLELDERLTREGVPHETRARLLTHAHAVLSSWNAGKMTTERAEHELETLLLAS